MSSQVKAYSEIGKCCQGADAQYRWMYLADIPLYLGDYIYYPTYDSGHFSHSSTWTRFLAFATGQLSYPCHFLYFALYTGVVSNEPSGLRPLFFFFAFLNTSLFCCLYFCVKPP